MGYTALLAGIVLGPSGAIMLLILPFVGRLTQKIDARLILAFGLTVSAYSLHYMSGFTLQIDIGTAILARNIQAIGISCFFVPLSYLTMAFVAREKMTNASAIFSLLRNLGGSFGVAFVTTLLARRAQFHQARLVDHLTPFDPAYVQALSTAKQYLDATLGPLADHTAMAAGYIYQLAQQQAAAMAFMDVFHAQALMFLGLVGFMWIIRSPKHGAEVPAGH
jgi:DHA2 family multidrug resistance protein